MSKWSKRSSVALDEETYAISKRVGNFSEFVRECLRRCNAYETGEHIHPTETDKCLPMSKKGPCILCWPYGPPSHEDWKYYRESGGRVRVGSTNSEVRRPIFENNVPYPNSWIEEKARELNRIPHFPIPQESSFKKSRTSPKTLGVRGYLARLLKRK